MEHNYSSLHASTIWIGIWNLIKHAHGTDMHTIDELFDDTMLVELLDQSKLRNFHNQKKWFFVAFLYTKYVHQRHLHHKEIEAAVNMNNEQWERAPEGEEYKPCIEGSWSWQPWTAARDELAHPNAMGLDSGRHTCDDGGRPRGEGRRRANIFWSAGMLYYNNEKYSCQGTIFFSIWVTKKMVPWQECFITTMKNTKKNSTSDFWNSPCSYTWTAQHMNSSSWATIWEESSSTN